VEERLASHLAEGARALGIALDSTQIAQLGLYAEELGHWNQRFNLTAIEDEAAIIDKHFLDSLACVRAFDLHIPGVAIDVGSGAGFPGLVLKIAFPLWQFVLLDSIAKRVHFLERVVARLGLRGVRPIHARAEDAGRMAELRERFDLVLARAVARLNVLSEYTLPFARPGGAVVAMKGPEIAEEIAEAHSAIALLGGGGPSAQVFTLPGTDLRRSLVTIPKVSPTPAAYPRKPGSAKKHPL
jgi:16S rRNA (guanine527-N7)-methyltransferase